MSSMFYEYIGCQIIRIEELNLRQKMKIQPQGLNFEEISFKKSKQNLFLKLYKFPKKIVFNSQKEKKK